jgi:hypothetical protein
MGTRPPLILSLAVAVALIGCGDDNYPNGGGSDMAAGGADMGVAFCVTVNVTAVDDANNQVMTAPARLFAVASGHNLIGAQWTVQRTGDAPDVPTQDSPSDPLRVHYAATEGGTYDFFVRFPSGCTGHGSIELLDPTVASQNYILRALPPESSGLPLTDTPFTIHGHAEKGVVINLDPGTPFTGTLNGPSGGVPGQLRFIADKGADAVVLTNAVGLFTVNVQGLGQYTPLLVPTSPTLAPRLFTQKVYGSDFGKVAFTVDAGAVVSGNVFDPMSLAVSGANVVLHAGAQPSTLGTSDAAGAFALRAGAGSGYTMTFGAPEFPEGAVENVPVPPTGPIKIQYTIGRVPVGGTVVASDGTTPVPNARVTITCTDPPSKVADVTINGALSSALGRVSRVVKTDAAGALPPLQLPSGNYDLVIEVPPPFTDGLTSTSKQLTGPDTWNLTLAKRITLNGIVRDTMGKGVEGVKVTAYELAGLGSAPVATTVAGGTFSLTVDPGAPIQLLAEPQADVHLAAKRMSVPKGTTYIDVPLGAGLQVHGTVYRGKIELLGYVRVELLCDGCGSETPLTTAIAGGDGQFNIYVPDPGDLILDGGVGD